MKILIILVLTIKVLGNVIGIDYGTDWFKITLLVPGSGLETILNRESKRKTNAAITIREGIRTFGVEADTLALRFPHWSYKQLKDLLGLRYSDERVQAFKKEKSSNTLIATSRGTVAFQHTKDTIFEVEELVAMLLRHCKVQAENYKGIKVSGAVITVPPTFTHFERRALMDAADIAGIKIFALINDEAAVAINYAVGKQFPSPEYHLFYDMGAGSTVATVVEFHSSISKREVNLVIKGYATDTTLGGRHIDTRIKDFLASEFMKKYKGKLSGPIQADDRAMARLQKEANRIKTILSVNQQVLASVENVMDGFDFKLPVTRETLENLCDDLFRRTIDPIESVLKSSNLTLTQIKTVVLFGGGVRVPAIQKFLMKFMGAGKIARNIDSDEAAVFGAALQGASLAAQFKLGQSTVIKDIGALPIHVSYLAENGENSNLEIVGKDEFLGTKKSVRFHRVTDFSFEVSYPKNKICIVKITGLTAAIAKFNESLNDIPIVNVQISLSESGLVLISSPTVFFEIKLSEKEAKAAEEAQGSIVDKIRGFFGIGNKKEKIVDVEDDSDGKRNTKKVKIKHDGAGNLIKTEKKRLKMEIDWVTVAPLSIEAKKKMKARLDAFDAVDKEITEREAALNNLETYIYKCKELFSDEDFVDLATDTERAAIKKGVAAASEWYDVNSGTAIKDDFVKENSNLSKLADPIFRRRFELAHRSSAVEKLLNEIKRSKDAYNMILDQLNYGKMSEELNHFLGFIENETFWIKERLEKQSKLKNDSDPILLLKDIDSHIEGLKIATENVQKRLKSKETNGGESIFNPELREMEQKLKDPNISQEDLLQLLNDAIGKFKKADIPMNRWRTVLENSMKQDKKFTEAEKKHLLEEALKKGSDAISQKGSQDEL